MSDSRLPIFSVVIPVFRGRDTVGRAVRSVDRQSLPPAEIIVVDNEPDPELERFIPATSVPTRVVREPQAGAGAARNRGLAVVRTPFTAFLDCDDEWSQHFLAEMAEAVTRHPDAVLFAGAARATGTESARTRRPGRLGRDSVRRILLFNSITTSATVVSTPAARACGGFLTGLTVGAGAEDWALWLKLLRTGLGVPVPTAMALRSQGNEEARGSAQHIYDDLDAAARHALGPAVETSLRRAARAGILFRRATYTLRYGDRSKARRGFRAAIREFPWTLSGWNWLLVAHAPASAERLARTLLRYPRAQW
jgi:glycosyltransferase involved in cell wall biosynthesis